MGQHEGDTAIIASEGSETALEILIRGQTDDSPEQRDYDSDERYKDYRHHKALDKEHPVATISRARIGEECHTRDESGEDGHTDCPHRDFA